MDLPTTAMARSRFSTPIGELAAFTSGEALLAIEFRDQGRAQPILEQRWPRVAIEPGGMPPAIFDALSAYFADASCRAFEGLDLRPAGSRFQQLIWTKLREIPLGRMISYGTLARQVGRPGAARAVGAANGQNPIPIIIPCHRVVGSDGRLTGYGSGVERKAWLLRHEGAAVAEFAGSRTIVG